MLRGDFAAAARALANPRLTRVPNWDNVFTDPVALHRALVARLQGDAAAAGRFADDAIAFCRTTRWTAKQEPFALLCTARAEAYAGRADAAVRDVEAAVTQIARSDNVAAMTARFEAARLYASLQRRDEALGALRELLRGPSYVSPVELRYDPLLAPLKEDPRFNEILGAARPL